MPTELETAFKETLAPVASALGFEMMQQDWGGRCSEVRLRSRLFDLEIFYDVIDEASVRMCFLKRGDRASRDYVDILVELLGSDFGLAEYLGSWRDDGFLPPNMQKMFAVIAETLPVVTAKLAAQNG